MARIDISSIMEKVGAYVKSQRGKEAMQRYINQCRTEGRSTTAAGDTIITEQVMMRAAEKLISMLKETAAQNNLPKSVKEHFDSLYYSEPILYGKESSQYKVDITFGDDLSRMSLLITSGKDKGKRTGNGIDNIVSLFDTGYSADKRVYGVWEGHGEDTIASLTQRDGMHFMSETVSAFNREWGALYNVYAYIPSENGRFYTSE